MTSSSSTPSSSLILIVNDLEFSGPRPDLDFVVSWGSIAVDSITRKVLDENVIYFKQPDNRKWDVECATEFWMRNNELRNEYVRAAIKNEGESVVTGTRKKVQWFQHVIDTYAGRNGKRVLFCGDTCTSDNMFMNDYLVRIDVPPIQMYLGFFRDTFCFSSYSLGLLRQGLPSSIGEKEHFSEDKMVRAHLGIPDHLRPATPADHHPINDCKNMIEEFWIQTDFASNSITLFNMHNYLPRFIAECQTLELDEMQSTITILTNQLVEKKKQLMRSFASTIENGEDKDLQGLSLAS